MRRILYICDRKKCKNCDPGCKHTTDIKHAKHFSRNYCNRFVEDGTFQDAAENMVYSLRRFMEAKSKEAGGEKQFCKTEEAGLETCAEALEHIKAICSDTPKTKQSTKGISKISMGDELKCLSCGGKIKLTKETFILGFDAEYIKCPHCKKKIDVQNYHMNGEKWQ